MGLRSRCADKKAQIARDLLESLEPLTGICTHDLLHQARLHRYGENYDQFDAAADQAELLLSLGAACHVPNNAPMTSDFQLHVRAFVEQLLTAYFKKFKNKIRRKLGEVGFGFKVRPIGSFPSDTKVDDIDEFDYLCVLDLPLDWYAVKESYNIKYGCNSKVLTPIKTRKFLRKLLYSKTLKHYCIDVFNESCKKLHSVEGNFNSTSRKLGVSKIYCHGPAVCLTLTWTCTNNHVHETSVDISFGIDIPDDIGNNLIPDTCLPGIHNFPNFGFTSQNLQKSCVHTYEDWFLSSCSCDAQIFDTFEEALTHNIRPLYRCLKIICAFLLPKQIERIYGRPRVYKHEWNETSVVSSHVLKCFVFHEVLSHPIKNEWTSAGLLERFKSILNEIADGYVTMGAPPSQWSWPYTTDIVTLSRVADTRYTNDNVLFISPNVVENFKSLSDHLSLAQCGQIYTDFVQEGNHMKGVDGRFHKIRMCEKAALDGFWNTYVYNTKTVERERHTPLYENHPMIVWCKTRVDELLRENKGLDLSETVDSAQLLRLAYGGCLTSSQLSSPSLSRLMKIIRKLEKLPDSAKYRSRFWETFLSGARYQDDIPDDALNYIRCSESENLICIIECDTYGLHLCCMTCIILSCLCCCWRCFDYERIGQTIAFKKLNKGENYEEFKTWWISTHDEIVGVATYHAVRFLVQKKTPHDSEDDGTSI